MTLRRPNLIALAVLVATFALAIATFTALNRSDGASPGDAAAPSRPQTTDGRIADLRAQVAAEPSKAGTHALLAGAYLQKVRETEDPVFYRPAERSLAAARRLAPRSAAVAIGYGELAMSKHNFREGLEWGERAHRAAPDLVRPLGLIVDAQIELGRYAAAERTLQTLVDRKPGVPAYSRISYFRELHGDIPGAIEAMRLAVAAAGSRPSDQADVQVLLGHLLLGAGQTAEGERLFRSVLATKPDHPKALDGLADMEISKGRPRAALARWRKLSAAVPSPHYGTDVVELSLAFGLEDDARRAIERVRLLDRRLAAAGANVASESAVFEADYGSPREALSMARRAYAEAPAVQRADALGWALTRAGRPADAIPYARKAMRLGTPQPMFLYHGAVAAKEAGRDDLAKRWFSRLLTESPRFSELHEPLARRALRELG